MATPADWAPHPRSWPQTGARTRGHPDVTYLWERKVNPAVHAPPDVWFRMHAPPEFLVIDFHSESRFLLVRTLLRKFPGAVIHESDDADLALELVRHTPLAAIIAHRTFEMSGVELVRRFRAIDPDVSIVMVSGVDREQAALAAGATSFLPYDEWLRIGSVVNSGMTDHPFSLPAVRDTAP